MSQPEDLLSSMFKFANLSGGQDINKILTTLIRNAQINMLKQLRREIDVNIKKLTQEGAEGVAYDEGLDPFKILGVEQNATREDIDKAFRKRAREVHPDRNPSRKEWANREMIKVNAAYEAIRQFRGWK